MSDPLPPPSPIHPTPTPTPTEENSIQTQTLDPSSPAQNQNPSTPIATHQPTSTPQIQEWEARARIWLSSLPNPTTVAVGEVEAWINSNQAPLPEELKSLSSSQLYERILSLNRTTPQSDQGKTSAGHPARFQRTDQWKPVYTWLESLDKSDVVKSKEINDWLSENPNVKEKLYAKHSRYHLMHYIQKCHMKILKRQGKLPKVSGSKSDFISEPEVPKFPTTKVPSKVINDGMSAVVVHSGIPSSNFLKNKDTSLTKRNDDFARYQLFTELESHLRSLFSKQQKQTTAGCLNENPCSNTDPVEKTSQH